MNKFCPPNISDTFAVSSVFLLYGYDGPGDDDDCYNDGSAVFQTIAVEILMVIDK